MCTPHAHTHTHRYICFIVGVVVAVRVSPLSRALFIKYASLGTPSATTVCHLSHAHLRILSHFLPLPFRGQVQLPCHSAHSGILRKAVLHADSSVDVPSILSVHCCRLCAHLQHCCCHCLYRVRFACLSTSLLRCGSYQRHTHTHTVDLPLSGPPLHGRSLYWPEATWRKPCVELRFGRWDFTETTSFCSGCNNNKIPTCMS